VSEIAADIETEAARLLGLAEREGVPLRLLGGLAIKLRAREGLPAPFRRTYADIDFVTTKRASGTTQAFLSEAGYTPHKAFNALHGNERLLFFDEPNDRQVDVFVGAFSMSHKIPLEGRVELEPSTLPVADLLLTKLQIAELNEKDVRDALALFVTHPVGDEDGETLNAARVSALCACDWGLWRTISGNLETTREYVGRYELSEADKETACSRIDELLERMEREPKTRGWKLRARVGERKRWYEVPEEVAGGP
jgi:putative nucleotidyltransferase-like protein